MVIGVVRVVGVWCPKGWEEVQVGCTERKWDYVRKERAEVYLPDIFLQWLGQIVLYYVVMGQSGCCGVYTREREGGSRLGGRWAVPMRESTTKEEGGMSILRRARPTARLITVER